MALFRGKKEDPPAQPLQGGRLNQSINDMRGQGMSSNQIVQSLQRDGANLGDINYAMNQAEMGPVHPQDQPYSGQQTDQFNYQSPLPDMPPPMGQSSGMDEFSMGGTPIEEVAESIIEEKWSELMKNVNKIVDWKNQMDSKFAQLEQKFMDLQHNYDELHKALVSKIGEYDQNILTVGSQVKAMEQVFSKVLPTFTQTVSELGRITGYAKGQPQKKKQVKDDEDSDSIDIPHELLHNL